MKTVSTPVHYVLGVDKELIICILQHIRNLEDLRGIAKLMGFTQDGVNSIEEVGTQEATPGMESVKYT